MTLVLRVTAGVWAQWNSVKEETKEAGMLFEWAFFPGKLTYCLKINLSPLISPDEGWG